MVFTCNEHEMVYVHTGMRVLLSFKICASCYGDNRDDALARITPCMLDPTLFCLECVYTNFEFQQHSLH
ncbi:unnamed protein product [Brassica rapa subsp. trilocularis]|uniref:(rape) hypothetical protein n=1 Tax=Brassica napus TaxID=3708 RepID=A0A816WRP3_BRANA|nr:unnamed protein product [Brassica napus]